MVLVTLKHATIYTLFYCPTIAHFHLAAVAVSSAVILRRSSLSRGTADYLDAFFHRTNGPARVPRYPDPPGSWGPSTGPRSLFSIVNDWGASFFVVEFSWGWWVRFNLIFARSAALRASRLSHLASCHKSREWTYSSELPCFRHHLRT